MNKEANFKHILDSIRKNQTELMDVKAFQTGVVPDEIIDEQMKLLPDTAKTILCVSDYGEYISHIKQKYGVDCKVYCLPSTLYGYNMCIQALSIYEENPSNFVIFNKDKYLYLEKDKYFEYIIRDEEMLYDCAIGNPPYDRRLHLKIINNILPNLNGPGVFIHPAGWLYDTNKYGLVKNFKIEKYFSQKDCQDIFGVVVQAGLVLSIFSDTFKFSEYNELYPKYSERLDISEIDFLKKIKSKITEDEEYDTWANHIKVENPNIPSKCVTVAQIVGGSNGRSMKLNHKNICTYVLEDGIVEKGDGHIGERFSDFLNSTNKESYQVIKEKAEEIYDYSKTGYTSALQDILFRYDQHPKYSKYLWMNTWTDGEYYDYFGLGDYKDEIERIIDKISRSEVKMKDRKDED